MSEKMPYVPRAVRENGAARNAETGALTLVEYFVAASEERWTSGVRFSGGRGAKKAALDFAKERSWVVVEVYYLYQSKRIIEPGGAK